MKKRILFYINIICRGGAERVILQLADKFHQEGYDTILVTSYPCKNEYVVPMGINRISLECQEIHQSKFMRNFTRIKKLRSIIKEEKPDYVIAFMQEPSFRAIIATRGLRTKTIVSVRNDPRIEYSGTIGKFVGKYILPVADGCVFQTERAMKYFPKKLQNKSTIIYNPVAEKFYNVIRKPVPGRVITCGRLEKQKNHVLLIDAFYKVIKHNDGAQLFIYGEGSLRNYLQKYIEKKGLEKYVVLMGLTMDVPSVLSEASIFVLSSDYEGMPNALMEAMAVGVPCVSTDCPCGGPRTLIEDKINGLLVPVNDSAKLGTAITSLLDNYNYAELLATRSKINAQSFKFDLIFKKWQEYIKSI